MGWWSANIMGGDDPLDILGVFAKICNCEFDYNGKERDAFHGYPFKKKMVNLHMDALLKKVEDKTADPLYGQVLGALILWSGAKMTDKARGIVISCAESDEWMKDDGKQSERGKQIQGLIKAVEQYKDGVRISL